MRIRNQDATFRSRSFGAAILDDKKVETCLLSKTNTFIRTEKPRLSSGMTHLSSDVENGTTSYHITYTFILTQVKDNKNL